jgi:hypothetical protein
MVPPIFQNASTCVEPDHRELIRSVGTVLHRRVRDNESADTKIALPLFCEDTHTEPQPEVRYEVTVPLLHLQVLSFPTLFTLNKLPPPKVTPRSYPVPDARTVATFIENIRQKARLTPQALVITLIYIDRLEARSEGVLLHARSWRPLVFASLLLASKVWHDISYWNCASDALECVNGASSVRSFLTSVCGSAVIARSRLPVDLPHLQRA